MFLIPLCLCKCCPHSRVDNNYLSSMTQFKGVLLEAFPVTLPQAPPVWLKYPSILHGPLGSPFTLCRQTQLSYLSCLPNCEPFEAGNGVFISVLPGPGLVPGVSKYLAGDRGSIFLPFFFLQLGFGDINLLHFGIGMGVGNVVDSNK